METTKEKTKKDVINSQLAALRRIRSICEEAGTSSPKIIDRIHTIADSHVYEAQENDYWENLKS